MIYYTTFLRHVPVYRTSRYENRPQRESNPPLFTSHPDFFFFSSSQFTWAIILAAFQNVSICTFSAGKNCRFSPGIRLLLLLLLNDQRFMTHRRPGHCSAARYLVRLIKSYSVLRYTDGRFWSARGSTHYEPCFSPNKQHLSYPGMMYTVADLGHTCSLYSKAS